MLDSWVTKVVGYYLNLPAALSKAATPGLCTWPHALLVCT